MSELKDAIYYLIQNYPESINSELSNARVTKMAYLSDWHQAINYGKQISNINWYFDNYGPFVWDVFNEVKSNEDLFEIKETITQYGTLKTIFSLKRDDYVPNLSDKEKQSLEHIINVTQKLYWDSFIKLVYSTFPVMSSERYTHLKLVEKAKQYKSVNAN